MLPYSKTPHSDADTAVLPLAYEPTWLNRRRHLDRWITTIIVFVSVVTLVELIVFGYAVTRAVVRPDACWTTTSPDGEQLQRRHAEPGTQVFDVAR